MGAPIFTEAELRRAMKVATEFGASIEICPRRGTIRILAGQDSDPLPSRDGEEVDAWDKATGLVS